MQRQKPRISVNPTMQNQMQRPLYPQTAVNPVVPNPNQQMYLNQPNPYMEQTNQGYLPPALTGEMGNRAPVAENIGPVGGNGVLPQGISRNSRQGIMMRRAARDARRMQGAEGKGILSVPPQFKRGY